MGADDAYTLGGEEGHFAAAVLLRRRDAARIAGAYARRASAHQKVSHALFLPLLGADSAKINHGAPERRTRHRASASARPTPHIRGRLCRAHGDIWRGAN